MLGLCVGDREARADCQVRRADRPHCGRRASPRAPLRRGARAYAGAIRRVPADHRAGVELATIDAHLSGLPRCPGELTRRVL
jgi:hypothetical protein